ncbi:hypothetical protein E1283_13800 [Streptomyces hainanensis]|uniref:Uncharacterized protein n=2 Tax=Streptomyces hainanensis TaxID=402648 RepID=A0A4R4TH53_9ACTN|nr:hypothetical protein E1283_13800 [Streptomyces hainanensis]
MPTNAREGARALLRAVGRREPLWWTTPTNAELAQRMKRSAPLDLTDADVPGFLDAERERR